MGAHIQVVHCAGGRVQSLTLHVTERKVLDLALSRAFLGIRGCLQVGFALFRVEGFTIFVDFNPVDFLNCIKIAVALS